MEMDPVAEVELRRGGGERAPAPWGGTTAPGGAEPERRGRVDNQLNYQKLFTDETCGVAPFVGFIVGPYDLRLPTRAPPRDRVRGLAEEGPGRRAETSRTKAKFTVTDEKPGKVTRRWRGRRKQEHRGENQPDGQPGDHHELHEQATRRGTVHEAREAPERDLRGEAAGRNDGRAAAAAAA